MSGRTGTKLASPRDVEEVGVVPKFVTIGYGDRTGYDRTDPAIRDARMSRSPWNLVAASE
jgi:hypothetical protein